MNLDLQFFIVRFRVNKFLFPKKCYIPSKYKVTIKSYKRGSAQNRKPNISITILFCIFFHIHNLKMVTYLIGRYLIFIISCIFENLFT